MKFTFKPSPNYRHPQSTTKIMGYLNNLTYLIESSDFTGSLRIPPNANEAKSVRYVRKIF